MFTGIIERKALVLALEWQDQTSKITVENVFDAQQLKTGDSIAVSGVCLTVVAYNQQALQFDLSGETLRRTTLGDRKVGEYVNLERALKLDAGIDGHLVTGHVDAKVSLLSRRPEHNSERLEWHLPTEMRPFIAEKGCVALDGISLTVGEVGEESFAAYIIPHTRAQVTTLDQTKVGDKVNLEVDLIARYVHRQLSFMDRQ